MSKRIKQISLSEFAVLLRVARQIHTDRNEPIPELGQDNWLKIEYALQAPFQYTFGVTPYRGFLKKACVQFYLIAKGHRLSNGNKRMACITLDYFCFINGKTLIISDDDLVVLARNTADSDAQKMEDCLEYVQAVLKNSIVDRTQ